MGSNPTLLLLLEGHSLGPSEVYPSVLSGIHSLSALSLSPQSLC